MALIQDKITYYNTLKKKPVIKCVQFIKDDTHNNNTKNLRKVITDEPFNDEIKIYIRTLAFISQYQLGRQSISIPFLSDISTLLSKYSNEEYTFTADPTDVHPSIFYDLCFDKLYFMKKYFPQNRFFNIRIQEERNCLPNLLKNPEYLPFTEEDHGASDGGDNSFHTLSIPYFVMKHSAEWDNLEFYDVSFTVTPANQRKDNSIADHVLRRFDYLSRELYSTYGSMLRDYFRYAHIDPVPSMMKTTSEHHPVFTRIDPAKGRLKSRNISSSFVFGSDISDIHDGSLTAVSLINDQLTIKEEMGTYYVSEDFLLQSRVVNVALYHMENDDNRIFDTKDYHGNFIESLYTVLPVNTQASESTVINNKYHFAFIYCIDMDKGPEKSYQDITCYIYTTKQLSTHEQNLTHKFSSFTEFLEFSSSVLSIKASYLHYVCKKTMPFILNIQNDESRINLYVTNNKAKWKGKIDDKCAILAYTKPSVIFFYNDTGNYFSTVEKYPSYQHIASNTHCIGTCNFDSAMVSFGFRKKGLLCPSDYDYRHIVKESVSLFKISLQIANLCHTNVHEILHGGKKLWYLRYLEYVMLKSKGYAKPCRLQSSQYIYNSKKDKPICMETEFSEMKYEKWMVKGAYIAPCTNTGLLETEATFFDYDAQYFSLICENSLGFTSHIGFRDMKNQDEEIALQATEEPCKSFKNWIHLRRETKKKLGRDSPIYTSLKLLNNGFYGCLAAKVSPIRSKLYCNLITFGGRSCMSVAYKVAKEMELNVIMAHTDSVCISGGNGTKNNCNWKRVFIDKVNNHFVNGMTYITLEEDFDKMVIYNRTTYVGKRTVTSGTHDKKLQYELCWDLNNFISKLLCDMISPDKVVMNTKKITDRLVENILDIWYSYNDILGRVSQRCLKVKGLMKKNMSLLERVLLLLLILHKFFTDTEGNAEGLCVNPHGTQHYSHNINILRNYLSMNVICDQGVSVTQNGDTKTENSIFRVNNKGNAYVDHPRLQTYLGNVQQSCDTFEKISTHNSQTNSPTAFKKGSSGKGNIGHSKKVEHHITIDNALKLCHFLYLINCDIQQYVIGSDTQDVMVVQFEGDTSQPVYVYLQLGIIQSYPITTTTLKSLPVYHRIRKEEIFHGHELQILLNLKNIDINKSDLDDYQPTSTHEHIFRTSKMNLLFMKHYKI